MLGVRIAKGFSRLFKEVSVSFGIRALAVDQVLSLQFRSFHF